MNNYPEIEILLNRYLQCETTEDEEQQLCDFFLSCDTLPEQWQPYKALFAYRQQQAAVTLPSDFVVKLTIKRQTRMMRRIVWRWTSIAACIVAGLSITYFAGRDNSLSHENDFSIAEARVAMVDALLMISDNLQKSETVINEGLCSLSDELMKLNEPITN